MCGGSACVAARRRQAARPARVIAKPRAFKAARQSACQGADHCHQAGLPPHLNTMVGRAASK